MKKEIYESFSSFSIIPGKVLIGKLLPHSYWRYSLSAIRYSNNVALGHLGALITASKEDIVDETRSGIKSAFETQCLMDPKKPCSAILLYAKGKVGKRYDLEYIKYVKLLDDPWPEYQVAGLYAKVDFSHGEIIFPIYYFYGKLKNIQTQVMKVFEGISRLNK